MNGVWRRSGYNNPYTNDDVAWQRIQDLQREADNRRMLAGAGRLPVELVALAWVKRSTARMARWAWNLPKGRLVRARREASPAGTRKETA